MKKSVVLKLPVTVELDKKTKTYSITYGRVGPVIFDDDTEVQINFPNSGETRQLPPPK